jgi:hypothetical protein
MSKSVSVTVNNPSLLSLHPSLSHERSQPWLESMPDFRSWEQLSEDEKLLCISSDKLNIRYNNMAAWEATGCMEEKWNDTIFVCVLSIMNNAICHSRSGHRRSSERTSPILRMLSPTGHREDAVPYLILVSEGKKANAMLASLKDDRTMKRYGFRFVVERKKIHISGADSTHDPLVFGPSRRTDSSICGRSILVRPSPARAPYPDRLATMGGVFELRPKRYFGLTSAHIFTESTVDDESSGVESGVTSPRESSGDDDSLWPSDNGRSSHSSAQNVSQLPDMHYVFESAPRRQYSDQEDFNRDHINLETEPAQIGVAFSPKQQRDYSADMLFNLSLDWALIEITDPKLWSANIFQTRGQVVRPRPGAGRTNPPPGDVLVLSGTQEPLRCRSIRTKSAINVDWASGFVEVWAIECKSSTCVI